MKKEEVKDESNVKEALKKKKVGIKKGQIVKKKSMDALIIIGSSPERVGDL